MYLAENALQKKYFQVISKESKSWKVRGYDKKP